MLCFLDPARSAPALINQLSAWVALAQRCCVDMVGDMVGASLAPAPASLLQPLRLQPRMWWRYGPCGDHALACPRTGLLAKRTKVRQNPPKSSSALGSAWHVRPSEPKVRSCRGSGSPAQTTATGVQANDRSRLDLVVYGATANTGALCCDATLVSPLTRTGHPHPCTVEVHGAALKVAERRKQCTYPELARGGPQKLLVLGPEIGGRWGTAAQRFVRDLVRLRAFRAPPAVRAAASSPWARRLVGSPFCRGPARRCEHGLGPCVAGNPATWATTILHWTRWSTSPPTKGPAACLCGLNSGPRAV